MAVLAPEERLYPCLLDRLTDDAPENKKESRDARVFSARKLYQAVLRDLGWLLNTTCLESTEDLEALPEVQASVLNYGIPDLTGKTVSGIEVVELQRQLANSIKMFESRIMPETLVVRVDQAKAQYNQNALTFEIEGELWSKPLPERLYLKTEIDLESGNITVTEG